MSCALALAAGAAGQAPSVVELARFPPGLTPTYASPAGSTPATEYSMCTGLADPATGAEFAIAGAENGLLFVETVTPRHSRDGLTGVTFDTWFFAEAPTSRWRGVTAFRDHVYSVQPFRAGIRRFRVDPTAAGSARVVDLGVGNTAQLANGLHRMTVDHDHGHLYVAGTDRQLGRPCLCIYDVLDEATDAVIDPPQLLAVWAPAGTIFDAHVTADRVFVALHKPGDPRWWQILDRTALPSTGASPYSWAPKWGEWRNSLPGGSNLSHDGYVSPDGSTWYTVTEGPGFMTGRDISALTPLTPAGRQFAEPAITGSYDASSASQMHAIEGIGLTGFVAHWGGGLHVIDLATTPGGLGADYPLIADYTTSSTPTTLIGDGAWDCYPHQDSGLVYVNDSEEGLFLLRVDRGQLNRYGPGRSNGVAVPRTTAEHGPPRLGRPFVLTTRGLQPGGGAVFALSFAEEPGYLAGAPFVVGGATVLIDPALMTIFFYPTGTEGAFAHTLPIPNVPSLVGARVFAQTVELSSSQQFAASRGHWFGVAN